MVLDRVIDRCHICGIESELTYEHIPARKAFNDTGVLISEMHPESAAEEGLNPSNLKIHQKGMGSYSLCPKCNSDTGGYYGSKFVAFCKKGMQILQASNYRPQLIYMMDFFPLAVIKQISSMFLSINSIDFRDRNVDLAQFVLNRDKKYLPNRYKFYIYFNVGGMHRATPHTTKIDLNKYTLENKKTSYMTEISYPPFGYLLTIESDKPSPDIVDITFFANYDFFERKTISMTYPVYATHTIFPSDYRSLEKIKRDVEQKGGIVP